MTAQWASGACTFRVGQALACRWTLAICAGRGAANLGCTPPFRRRHAGLPAPLRRTSVRPYWRVAICTGPPVSAAIHPALAKPTTRSRT